MARRPAINVCPVVTLAANPKEGEAAPSPANVTDVVALHGNFLWRTLQRLGVSEAYLPDVSQELLLVVHRRLHTFDGRTALRAWLFGVCLRVVLAHRRTAHVRRERPFADVPEDAEAEPIATPEDEASAAESRRALQQALDELTPEKRAVFVMYELEGIGCDEIAETMGVPRGTVHSRLHVARNDLRAALSSRFGQGARGGGK